MSDDLRLIKRALISVYDKSKLLTLAQFLSDRAIEIISTGKTAQYLNDHGIAAKDISFISHTNEILDGRVKTLNSRVFASLLFDRTKPEHCATIDEHNIPAIDLVVVNLYPFQEIAARTPRDERLLIENIDVGGPSMLRAAAKNFMSMTVLSAPSDYDDFMEHYARESGTRMSFRRERAARVFALTCEYDRAIAASFTEHGNDDAAIAWRDEKSLRYGENPHQAASVFSNDDGAEINLATTTSLAGKELSYNNLLDAHAAIATLRSITDHRGGDFSQCAAVVIKHGIPCGAAIASSVHEALTLAITSDPKSAFGGIVALGGICDLASAQMIADGFFEAIIASDFSSDALGILSSRKNLRLLPIANLLRGAMPKTSLRSIIGGVLQQDFDHVPHNFDQWTTVTDVKPDEKDFRALDLAFRVVKNIPSNGICLASAQKILGVGAGQPNRIQSVELAIAGARARNFDLSNAALASDGFFPFDDGIRLAHEHGIRLIIQPGGSIKDHDVIKTANDLGLAMILTHRRHFRH